MITQNRKMEKLLSRMDIYLDASEAWNRHGAERIKSAVHYYKMGLMTDRELKRELSQAKGFLEEAQKRLVKTLQVLSKLEDI